MSRLAPEVGPLIERARWISQPTSAITAETPARSRPVLSAAAKRPTTGRRCAALAVSLLAGSAARAEVPAPAMPRVRVVVAQPSASAPTVVIPGDVQARYLSNISFRTNGRIVERLVEVGQHVGRDQVLARVEPDQQRADLRDAEAALAAARASAEQAKLTLARQQELMKGRYTTVPAYDQAEQQARVTQAEVDADQARLGSAREQLAYTDLRAGIAGIVTARNAEVGQVVKQGDTVFVVAQDGDRDAVFNVYEGLLAKPPESRQVDVSLITDPAVRTTATVREISPLIDASSGAVRVKATLKDAPARMALGATVLGAAKLNGGEVVVLPWSALFRWKGAPAVWVVGADGTAGVRRVTIDAYVGTDMVLKDGVAAGDRVVTAGIQFLHPGQRVAVVEGSQR